VAAEAAAAAGAAAGAGAAAEAADAAAAAGTAIALGFAAGAAAAATRVASTSATQPLQSLVLADASNWLFVNPFALAPFVYESLHLLHAFFFTPR